MSITNVPLINLMNQRFLINSDFGNNYNQYLLVDTGSSDTWGRGTVCVSTGIGCTGNKMAGGVGTFEESAVEVTYAGGFTSAYLEIYSGSPTFGSYSVSNIFYGNATEIENIPSIFDGVLGLAQLDASAIYQTTSNSLALFMIAASSPTYGIYFTDYNNVSSPTSLLNIGGYSSSLYYGSLNWLTSNSNKYWQISASGSTVTATGASIDFSNGGTKTTILFDTGTPNLLFGSSVASSLCMQIGCTYNIDESTYVINCANYNSLPSINITAGSGFWSIPPKYYVRNYTSQYSGAVCSIIFTASSGSLAILGAPLFLNYYSAYNLATGQIGFALRV